MYNDDSTADHPQSRDGLSAEQLQKLKIAIPGYRVLNPIARGGQGDVYKAEQEGIGQVVAVKVMHGGFRDDERLDREAQILGALANVPTPNIVKIIDRGTMPDGRQFLVTRYIDGRPLNEYLSEPRLRADLAKDPSAPLRLFLKVCKVIGDQTHRYGVVHRDLSPSNILIDNSQEPHILDFGLEPIREPQQFVR